MIETPQIELPTDLPSAGGLLRQARISKGMHIATLSSVIKVPQRKLELLELDQWDELPDMAFARALAQTVCRTLELDASAVMTLLPVAHTHRIEQLSEGLNAPFYERSAHSPLPLWTRLRHPAVLGPCSLLFAAAVLWAIPSHWLNMPVWMVNASASLQGSPVAQNENLPVVAESFAATILGAASAADFVVAGSLTSQQDISGIDKPLELRVVEPTLVEVTDGQGIPLLRGKVQHSEPIFLGGVSPLRVRIDSSSSAQVRFRGQLIDLTAFTKNNVAHLELH